MNKQTFVLIGAALVLAILYIVNFTDWLKHKNIQIHWTLSRSDPSIVMFYLDKEYSLTAVEMVSAEDAKTNKFPHALWHMVASSGSTPVANFNYGAPIPGMSPQVATAVAEPLQTNVNYTLMVTASSGLKGEKEVTLH